MAFCCDNHGKYTNTLCGGSEGVSVVSWHRLLLPCLKDLDDRKRSLRIIAVCNKVM
jgi:hypothetical protein